MEAQQKPEGLKRPQAGVKTPAKADDNISPEGATECPATPSGLVTTASTGVSPLSVVSTPLWGYPPKMCIKSSPFKGRG